LRIKLKSLDKINEHKQLLASIYLNNLNKDYKLPVINKDYSDVYHIFNILHKKRDEIRDYLLKNEIKTEVHYPVPPNKQKALSFLNQKAFPVSEKIHSSTISLPVSAIHSAEEIYRVVEILNKF